MRLMAAMFRSLRAIGTGLCLLQVRHVAVMAFCCPVESSTQSSWHHGICMEDKNLQRSHRRPEPLTSGNGMHHAAHP